MKIHHYPRVYIIVIISFLVVNYGYSQQTMSIGDSNPKDNAILYLKGNGTQGLIIPIVNSLGNFGESGMLVYNSGDKNLYYHDGSNWISIGSSSSDLNIGNEVSQVGTNGALVLSGTGSIASPLSVSLVSGTIDGQTLRWNNTSKKWELAIPSGLSSSLLSTQIYVGNASNVAAPVPLSGDATISNAGALTIANNAVNSGKIADGTIVNNDIAPAAAISPSKIAQSAAANGDVLKWNGTAWTPAADAQGVSTTLASGQIFVGSAANAATAVPVSGDATLVNTGALSIAANAVTSAKIADGTIASLDIADGAIGTADITDGTIVNNDINVNAAIAGTKVAPAFGSQPISTTGALSAAGAITLGGLSGTGNRVVYAGPTGVLGTQTPYSLLNYVPKGDGTNLIASQIFDDGTNVGIGTITPAYKLDVHRTSTSPTDAQLHVYNPSEVNADKSGIRFGVGSFWAVHLQTVLSGDWLQLTNNAGAAYHRWTSNSYYPGAGTGYIIGQGSGLSILGGNVGIGNSAPTQALDVTGNIKTSGYLYFSDNKYLFHVVGSYSGIDDHWIPNQTNLYDLGNTSWRWRTLYTVTNPNVSSDLRLKKNVKNLNYGLSTILNLRPVTYQLKSNHDNKVLLGLIAQEVKEIIPEIVVEDNSPEKIMGVTYSDLIPVLINAIKEQQKVIDDQKKQLEKLQQDLTAEVKKSELESTEFNNLKAEVAEIKRIIGSEAKAK